MPRLRPPSPSMVVALVALVVALGGTSYAALKVTSKTVVNNSLTSADIRNGTLLRRDFKTGELPSTAAPAVLQGPAGPAGAAGAAGAKGADGAPGLSGYERVEAASASNTDLHKTAVASCPAGKRAIGSGGHPVGSGAGQVAIGQIRVRTDFGGFDQVSVAAETISGTPTWSLVATAICATVAP